MLLANKRVAEFVYTLSKGPEKNTMVYRVHEAPDPDRLKTFATFVAKLGHKLEVDDEKQIAKSMNSMLQEVEGKPEQNLIEQLGGTNDGESTVQYRRSGALWSGFQTLLALYVTNPAIPGRHGSPLLQHYLNGGKSVNKEIYEAPASTHPNANV